MADELTEALWSTGRKVYLSAPEDTNALKAAFLAVARVALERAAEHLRAEAAERIAGLRTTEDRDTSHLVIGLLLEMAGDIEGMLPEKETTI